MNIARNRRRLIAARRYSARCATKRSTPYGPPVWDTWTTDDDSRSALKSASRLAKHAWSNAAREAIYRTHGDHSSCSGEWPPCGGCARCIRAQVMYYRSTAYDNYVLAEARLWARINPWSRNFVADNS